ncbi:DUF6508 domain-containing protein [Streptomyces hygroscopicus]|uniref:DUF6508 domain-containing protein n=1 Tax=Streptomyces hygroscopicus TaxID=1912 RepID=UPI0036C6C63E
MTYGPDTPRYHATTDKPVHYLAVANARGEPIGYLWANDEDGAAGWCPRPAGDPVRLDEGQEWLARLGEAKGRGLAPTAALAELVRGSDPRRPSHIVPGSLTAAADLTALTELAGRITEADDRRLLARLDRANSHAWHELRQGLAELTDEDRDVQWRPARQNPSGTWTVGYPIHSERLNRVIRALVAVGAVTPAYLWIDNPPPTLPPDGRLSPADAMRAATAIVRGERFSDGTIAQAARDGLIDAVGTSLCAWYAAEQGHDGRT